MNDRKAPLSKLVLLFEQPEPPYKYGLIVDGCLDSVIAVRFQLKAADEPLGMV